MTFHEAKKLAIRMGKPYIKSVPKKHDRRRGRSVIMTIDQKYKDIPKGSVRKGDQWVVVS